MPVLTCLSVRICDIFQNRKPTFTFGRYLQWRVRMSSAVSQCFQTPSALLLPWLCTFQELSAWGAPAVLKPCSGIAAVDKPPCS